MSEGMRYLEDVVTLAYDPAKCTGCTTCTVVCPHGCFAMRDGRAVLADRGACIECGACKRNCAAGAIDVQPGVGCAAAIIGGWLRRSEPTCGGDAGSCC